VFRNVFKRSASLALIGLALVFTRSSFAQESGDQVINGTRVFTQIDHARGVATFSNDCGSQTLTQQELQGGAIPSDIIPCPRPSERVERPSGPPSSSSDRGSYGATATAIYEDDDEEKVASGIAWNYSSQSEADQAALDNCSSRGGRGCKVVGRFSNGNCGYVATGSEGSRVCWGSAGTADDALDACHEHGCSSCRTPIGGCTNRMDAANTDDQGDPSPAPPSQPADASPDIPSRPDDPVQCISSWRAPMANGYIDWKVTNSCDVAITFDYDDCDMNEDLLPVCTVKTDSVPARSYYTGSNYHKPANARNYR
jgi:Domain of unknown function (DUF4189)